VVAAAALVYWPFLGYSGFAFSEGQRVLPGWNMAHSGDWLVPRLFEQPYLRKPPGMPWAVALTSLVFGESEFSARSVSAFSMTLAALLSFGFATRWFGRPWGLAAGLASVLTPLFFLSPTSPVGRSAEIEALHNLFVQGSMLVMIHLLVAQAGRRRPAAWALALALAAAGMALVKGPAGLPCLGGAIFGACIAQRSARPLRRGGMWTGLAIGAAIVGFVAWKITQRVHQLPQMPVTEPASRFLWRSGENLAVLALPLTTLLSALPTSLSLPLAFGLPSRPDTDSDEITRALAWTCLCSMLIYAVVGVSNTRYTMPAITILPCLWAPVLRCHFEQDSSQRPAWRRVLLDRIWIWDAALLLAGIASIAYTEPRRAHRTSGRDAGAALGEVLKDRTEIWGDQLADNRPEVFYYAQRRAHELGRAVRPRWIPTGSAGPGDCPLPPPGGYIALLDGEELERYQGTGRLEGLAEVFAAQAHKFEFRVFRVPD
jgi:4-amino-4-deoxy-L-arabinose transferase-like glycosyltransferase